MLTNSAVSTPSSNLGAQPTSGQPSSNSRDQEETPSNSPPETTESSNENNTPAIDVGDTVHLRLVNGDHSLRVLTITDSDSDPQTGQISGDSTFGNSLIGANEGDEIDILENDIVRKAIVDQITKGSGTRKPKNSRPEDCDLADNSLHRTTTTLESPQAASRPQMSALEDNATTKLDPSQFYEIAYTKVIREFGTGIIDRIGPVTFRHLTKIIATSHGFKRTGDQIRKQVLLAVSKVRSNTTDPYGELIFWPENAVIKAIVQFREMTIHSEPRTWQDVPYPEKLGLAAEIARENKTHDLAAEMASRIGLGRLKKTTREDFEELLSTVKTLSS